MYVKIEIDGLTDAYDKLDLGYDAEEIIEKICEAELGIEADETFERHFYRQTPEDWEVDEYITEQLLDDMGIDDIDEIIDGMREEGE